MRSALTSSFGRFPARAVPQANGLHASRAGEAGRAPRGPGGPADRRGAGRRRGNGGDAGTLEATPPVTLEATTQGTLEAAAEETQEAPVAPAAPEAMEV